MNASKGSEPCVIVTDTAFQLLLPIIISLEDDILGLLPANSSNNI